MKITIPIYPGLKTATQGINNAYLSFVKKAGYDPLVVHQWNSDDTLTLGDGLLLPGGVDVDPIFYNSDNYESSNCDPRRDAFERKLISLYREHGKPIFGICRGLQLLFLEFAQGLYLVPSESKPLSKSIYFSTDIAGHPTNNGLDISRSDPVHIISMDGILVGKEGNFRFPTNSLHHQGVVSKDNKLHVGADFNGLIVKALSASSDGPVVEAFDIPDWGVRAVQWHPEEMGDVQFIKSFFGE